MKKERKVSKEMKSPSKPPRTERKTAHSKNCAGLCRRKIGFDDKKKSMKFLLFLLHNEYADFSVDGLFEWLIENKSKRKMHRLGFLLR